MWTPDPSYTGLGSDIAGCGGGQLSWLVSMSQLIGERWNWNQGEQGVVNS